MKIRSGFVSNSSSSSFVIIVDKKVHDNIVQTLNEYEQAVIKKIAEEKKLFGTDAVVIGEANDMGGNSSLFYDGFEVPGFEEEDVDAEESEHCPSAALYTYIKQVKKQPKNTWYEWEADI